MNFMMFLITATVLLQSVYSLMKVSRKLGVSLEIISAETIVHASQKLPISVLVDISISY